MTTTATLPSHVYWERFDTELADGTWGYVPIVFALGSPPDVDAGYVAAPEEGFHTKSATRAWVRDWAREHGYVWRDDQYCDVDYPRHGWQREFSFPCYVRVRGGEQE